MKLSKPERVSWDFWEMLWVLIVLLLLSLFLYDVWAIADTIFNGRA